MAAVVRRTTPKSKTPNQLDHNCIHGDRASAIHTLSTVTHSTLISQ
ncbi:hypothetical protein MMEU_1425 [Mycobacterium marinum str. Europe]|nr:hypothetical protein MMEU_1425 [Mycobacterium marinum str. Europe]